ncbi:hypothetical protein [Burkholderia sp. AU6039]|uniref:hypothetical protein n=1 Tax=Burkholderia sp. AU6039 TaxID=2015344 RepID=UPI0035944256
MQQVMQMKRRRVSHARSFDCRERKRPRAALRYSASMNSAQRSAIMIVGAFVLPDTMRGITDASQIVRRAARTRAIVFTRHSRMTRPRECRDKRAHMTPAGRGTARTARSDRPACYS